MVLRIGKNADARRLARAPQLEPSRCREKRRKVWLFRPCAFASAWRAGSRGSHLRPPTMVVTRRSSAAGSARVGSARGASRVPTEAKLAFAVAGIFFAFGAFAVLQEDVYRTSYAGERFIATFLVLIVERSVNTAVGALGALLLARPDGGRRERGPRSILAIGKKYARPGGGHRDERRLADARDGVRERGAAVRLVPDAGSGEVVQDDPGHDRRRRRGAEVPRVAVRASRRRHRRRRRVQPGQAAARSRRRSRRGRQRVRLGAHRRVARDGPRDRRAAGQGQDGHGEAQPGPSASKDVDVRVDAVDQRGARARRSSSPPAQGNSAPGSRSARATSRRRATSRSTRSPRSSASCSYTSPSPSSTPWC